MAPRCKNNLYYIDIIVYLLSGPFFCIFTSRAFDIHHSVRQTGPVEFLDRANAYQPDPGFYYLCLHFCNGSDVLQPHGKGDRRHSLEMAALAGLLCNLHQLRRSFWRASGQIGLLYTYFGLTDRSIASAGFHPFSPRENYRLSSDRINMFRLECMADSGSSFTCHSRKWPSLHMRARP